MFHVYHVYVTSLAATYVLKETDKNDYPSSHALSRFNSDSMSFTRVVDRVTLILSIYLELLEVVMIWDVLTMGLKGSD